VVDKYQESNLSNENKEFAVEEVRPVMEKPEVLEDVSDVSDSVDGVAEVLQHDSEDRDASPVNWDTDSSEVHPPTEVSGSGVSGLSSVPNGTSDKRSTYAMDDSSSTCSTDSVPSVVMNDPYKGNSYLNYQFEKLPSRYVVNMWPTRAFSTAGLDYVAFILHFISAEGRISEVRWHMMRVGQLKWIISLLSLHQILVIIAMSQEVARLLIASLRLLFMICRIGW
jgi:hypothetical protein